MLDYYNNTSGRSTLQIFEVLKLQLGSKKILWRGIIRDLELSQFVRHTMWSSISTDVITQA